jgi:hypothetical protein
VKNNFWVFLNIYVWKLEFGKSKKKNSSDEFQIVLHPPEIKQVVIDIPGAKQSNLVKQIHSTVC